MRRALITGITGQDGSYLADLLLEKGYEVHGLVRPGRVLEQSNVAHLLTGSAHRDGRLRFHEGDLRDGPTLARVLRETSPDEIYHLAGQTHVGRSAELAEVTGDLTGMGTLRLLEGLRRLERPSRFLHASSSEIFGHPDTAPQDETTPMRPVTVYGCAKAFGTHLVRVYREGLSLFCTNVILYNHESPRRPESFVTQKICRAAAAIKQGGQRQLLLGSLAAQRDWGDARDFVWGMWLALQNASPDDFILATGETRTVQDVVEIAFDAAGLNWREHVHHDPGLVRVREPARLVGNAAKAKRLLGWHPRTRFEDLIRKMTVYWLEDPPSRPG